MRDQAADRIVRAENLGDFESFRIVVESTHVGDLPARLGIDRGAVEHDFGLHALANSIYLTLLGNDRLDAAIASARAEVKVSLRLECFCEFRIDRVVRV